MANRMKTKDKGGRPAHTPDDRSRQMIEVLSGFGIPQDKIADVIGVDGKTLRKHCATELQRGAATVEAKLVGNLLKLAGGSDGTALTFALQCRFGWSLYAPPPAEPKRPLGKEGQLQMEAETAHAGLAGRIAAVTGWNFACADWEQRLREGRSLVLQCLAAASSRRSTSSMAPQRGRRQYLHGNRRPRLRFV